MKRTIPAPFQTERHALRARLAVPTADEATRLQTRWQGRGVMIRNWLSSRQTQVLLALTLLGVERIAAQVFGLYLLPGLGTETGMLLLWGIVHCDTLNGPLVVLAKKALEEKNVNLVRWMRTSVSKKCRSASERASGPRSRTTCGMIEGMPDFRIVFRAHPRKRAGEGAPFTGLKPAGLDLGPAVPAADRALKTGSADALVKLLVDAVSAGVRARFHTAAERQRFDPNDVAAGRRYVEAYVPYVHYVERLWEVATGPVHGHPAEHEAQAHQSEHAAHHH